MKVVILAGGYGTRLGELTSKIPKPMVSIGGYPILWHIMNIYAANGVSDFIVALGYKGDVIKNYFINYFNNHSDFTVDLGSGSVSIEKKINTNWRVTLVDTGIDTMTGGRVKRLAPYLDKRFMMTYGDGLADINIKKLLAKHDNNKKILTMTVVHPTSKYGRVELDASELVTKFQEKPEFSDNWINGGFMVAEPELLDYITGDNIMLEGEPLSKIADLGQLGAYKHTGFWYCMDTLRDRTHLNEMWIKGSPPWKIW